MILSRYFNLLHFPKTGGTWYCGLIKNKASASWAVQHRYPGHWPCVSIPKEHWNLPTAIVVRHPLDWYVSYFHFFQHHLQNRTGGFSQHAPPEIQDETFRSLTENDFAATLPVMLEYFPHFPLSRYFDEMTHHPKIKARVLRFENLREELANFIGESEAPSPDKVIEAVLTSPGMNESQHDDYRSYYSKELVDLVWEKDKEYFRKFGFSHKFQAMNSSKSATKLNSLRKEIISKAYSYKRVGYGERPMKFLPNGKIGVGKAGCEKNWRLRDVNGKIQLEIFYEHALTCVLSPDKDKVWRGNWQIYEKMPIELSPVAENEKIKIPKGFRFNSRGDVEAAGRAESGFYYDTLDKKQIIAGRMLSSYWIAAKENDVGISEHIKHDGFWESWITLWIVRNVKPGTVCIDAGANYGYFTFLLAQHGCTVTAIEANPEIIPFLKKSVKLNNCKEQVKIINAAVADKKGEIIKLNLKESSLNSTIVNINSQSSYEIKTITLDSVADNASFVKMDIEGAEERAWEGMKKLKSQCVTLMEFVPDHYKERGRLFFNNMNETHHITYVDYTGNEQPLHGHDFFLRDTEPFRMLVLRSREK